MTINPTKARRTVVLDIQLSGTKPPHPDDKASAGAETITRILLVVDDGVVTEASFSGAAERDLLRQFWQLVQPHDVFFGRNIAARLEFVRQRSWKVGLIPSPGIDLRTVYQFSTVDVGGQESTNDDAEYRSAGALVNVLGLPGNGPGARKCRVP